MIVEEEEEIIDPREQAFHNMIREYVIFVLIFVLLYICSYAMISSYRKRREEFYADEDDALVYRISSWMCILSLAISIGAALLLPFSIVTNEVLLLYPDSYYIQWLNDSLIQGLWNYVFLFSNISLFVLLPFAYFFTEAEGFSGSRKGIMGRVNEAIVLLLLLSILVLGMTYLLCSVLGYNDIGLKNLFNLWQYLPFLYSCVSFFGVLLLLLCTPIGIARLFDVFGQLIVKPQFLRNIQEEYEVMSCEEVNLRWKLENVRSVTAKMVTNRSKSLPPLPNNLNGQESNRNNSEHLPNSHNIPNSNQNGATSSSKLPMSYHTASSYNIIDIENELLEIKKAREKLEFQKKASAFRRNLGYPLAMLALLCLTLFAVLIVVTNTLELLVGIKALPISSAQQFTLGITSLSKMGPIGAGLEITLILYLWCASVVGFYTLPLFGRLQPRLNDTSFTQIIGNCIVLLVLSSALPVLSRTVGITNFDLLGHFGRIEWLGNFYVVLSYNSVFAVATALILINQSTAAMRRELFKRLQSAIKWLSWLRPKRKWSHSDKSLLNKFE